MGFLIESDGGKVLTASMATENATKVRRLIKMPTVTLITAEQPRQIYRLMDSGHFPRPVKVGKRAVAWYLDEVAAWIDSRPRA